MSNKNDNIDKHILKEERDMKSFVEKCKVKSVLAAVAVTSMLSTVHAGGGEGGTTQDYHSIQDVFNNEAIGGENGLMSKIGPMIRFLIYGAEAIAVVSFTILGVMNLVLYFKHTENPQEATQYKRKATNLFIGAGVAFAASMIINMILVMLGVGNIFQA